MSIRDSSTHTAAISIRTRSTGAFRTTAKTQYETFQQTRPTFRFSVVICTYNRRNMVLATLASLRRQSLPFKFFEVIVVDNGSADGTFNAIQTYLSANTMYQRAHEEQWSVRCLLEERNGLAYARNTGVLSASGEILVFLDDDVLVDQHFLEQLLATYEETPADAVGGSVNLHWESYKPYWLTSDMLDTFGYYMPFHSRTQLPDDLNFSNSCFSIRRQVLQQLGGFSPFLTRRLHTPLNVEALDLCRRLRQQRYKLWYEPAAQVSHRVAAARLARPFLVGRAYWQGRSEILAEYAHIGRYQDVTGGSVSQTVRSLLSELRVLLPIIFIERLLLSLAHRPSSERLLAAMGQAHSWGRIRQLLLLSNHAPKLVQTPFVLMIQAQKHDADGLVQALLKQGVYCTTSIANIPFSWIWRHRAYKEAAIGIVHFYRPGAFELNHWQRQQLLFKLWLAQKLGLAVVSTDVGGWWHNVRSLQHAGRRAFERRIFACSHMVYTSTRLPEQFYQQYSWRKRSRFLAYPGLRATLPSTINRLLAYTQLGIPSDSDYVFLCLMHMHTEREVLQCIEAFSEMRTQLLRSASTAPLAPQLLLVGMPRDKKGVANIVKRAALNSSLHIFLEYRPEDLALYVAACDALVMPYCKVKSAGEPDIAMLFYSYERVVISPNLPRFHGLIPQHAGILYTPDNHSSLVQAFLLAPKRSFKHTEKEAAVLDYHHSWRNYALILLDSYQSLLNTLKKKKS
ncbi:hypothetical protein KDA_24670 [Dictyobacter alpinus]|uniref:Glycosyltransferase 2-like domain-containing protein n=1 Tax=Dictyobacter alpinus TaxID=2014873 RepID=A0A402B6I8_9CHLR|nr:glycosyltransferase [Dictyobacter alpinus]GCE26983.1 hypothetical protein KDA_24670 [Dictyobacter alpinus]